MPAAFRHTPSTSSISDLRLMLLVYEAFSYYNLIDDVINLRCTWRASTLQQARSATSG